MRLQGCRQAGPPGRPGRRSRQDMMRMLAPEAGRRGVMPVIAGAAAAAVTSPQRRPPMTSSPLPPARDGYHAQAASARRLHACRERAAARVCARPSRAALLASGRAH